MRRRMAAKIGPMNMPPQRIALFALVLLVLVGGGTWWWYEPGAPAAQQPVGAPTLEQVRTPEPGPLALPPSAIHRDPAGRACSDALMAAFNARARELAQRFDAASQVAYALAVPFPKNFSADRGDHAAYARAWEQRRTEAQGAWLRAARLAPNDPDVLWLAGTQCGNAEPCRALQASLLAAEPDNIAVWLWETGWARMRDDPGAVARAMDAAASAHRYESHVGAVHEAMLDAYGDLPLPSACATPSARAAMRAATGLDHDLDVADQALMLATLGLMTPSADVRRNCLPEGAIPALGSRGSCLRIAERLAEGGDLLQRALSLNVLVQLSVDTPDAARWRERYREFLWLSTKRAEPGVQALMRMEDYSLEEVNSVQAVLEATGRWPPPADWLPKDDYYRSLVLTGRPPAKKKPGQAP